MTDTVARVAALLAANGLILRGGFVFGGQEATPPAIDGRPARAILLVGQAGAGMWPHFQDWVARSHVHTADPLDTWSRMVVGEAAKQVGARAVSPSDRPYWPFQRWAMRAEGLKASPLGILIHPQNGLWHAYRGALHFDRELGLEAPREVNHPCDACVGKPCLNSCPAGAVSDQGLDYVDCLSHVRSANGHACMESGCLARDACPVGRAWVYCAEQKAFHMSAYAR